MEDKEDGERSLRGWMRGKRRESTGVEGEWMDGWMDG